MRLGLYQTFDPILGEAARVHESAGDAAPYLSRYLYELLDFQPAFDSLPSAREFEMLAQAEVIAHPDPATAAALYL